MRPSFPKSNSDRFCLFQKSNLTSGSKVLTFWNVTITSEKYKVRISQIHFHFKYGQPGDDVDDNDAKSESTLPYLSRDIHIIWSVGRVENDPIERFWKLGSVRPFPDSSNLPRRPSPLTAYVENGFLDSGVFLLRNTQVPTQGWSLVLLAPLKIENWAPYGRF